MTKKKQKTCPFCGEEIIITAQKCKYCGEWLNKNNEDYLKKIDKSIVLISLAMVAFLPVSFTVACIIGLIGGVIRYIVKESFKNKTN